MNPKPYTRIKLDPFERRLAVSAMELGLTALRKRMVEVAEQREQGLCRERISLFEDVIQRILSSRRIALPNVQMLALQTMLRAGDTPAHRVIARKLDDARGQDEAAGGKAS